MIAYCEYGAWLRELLIVTHTANIELTYTTMQLVSSFKVTKELYAHTCASWDADNVHDVCPLADVTQILVGVRIRVTGAP